MAPTQPPKEEDQAPARPPGGMAVSASSRSFDADRIVSWGITLAVIAVAGLVLFLVRAHVATAIERLPAVSLPAPAPEPVPLPEPAPLAPEEPQGPQMTWDQVAEGLDPLPDQLRELIASGRGDLPGFVRLRASNSNEALVRNRWHSWTTVWLNRVKAVEDRMPPVAECEVHPDLSPACAKFREVLGVLRETGTAEIAAAEETLDRAEETLELFLNPPEEEEADTAEDASAELGT